MYHPYPPQSHTITRESIVMFAAEDEKRENFVGISFPSFLSNIQQNTDELQAPKNHWTLL